MNLSSFSRLAAALAIVFTLIGCAASPASNRSAWRPNRHTAPVVTPYWDTFPPSAGGLNIIPNRTLAAGTPVRFLGNRWGFAEVQMETLERGWVPQGTLDR